ncbi:MAG TPA: tetratricopeptide repeat protein [Herpetosiphonaceae bacterium]
MLEQMLREDIPNRRGRTIVITGPLGSGRAALARFALWESLYKLPRSYEIAAPAGKLYQTPPPEDTQALLRWEAQGDVARRAFLGDIAQRLPFPIGTIVAVLTSLLPEAQRQARTARLSASITPLDLLPLVADAAGAAPFALHITGVDAPDLDRQWVEVVIELAQFIYDRWPVLLLISMESPRSLMLLQEYQATTLQWSVRSLVEAGIVQNWHLGPVSKTDVAHYIHQPVDDAVIDQLHVLSGGWPLMVQALWRDWRNSAHKATRGGERTPILTGDGFVEPWRFTPYGARSAQHVEAVRDTLLDAYPDVLDMLAVLLNEEEDPRTALDYILGIAALEGRTFTGMAVAKACGFSYDDELEEIFDALVQAGMLIHEPGDVVGVPTETGTQWLYCYRFRLPIWWHLFHEGWSVEARQEMVVALATALEATYGRYVWQRAMVIIGLWEQIGRESLARMQRHLWDQWAHISVLEGHARDATHYAEQHGTWLTAHDAWLKVAAAMWSYVPDDLAFATFDRARSLAERAGSPLAIAETLAHMANRTNLRGNWGQAEQWTQEALAVVAPYHDTAMQRVRGLLWHEIGVVYAAQEQWAEALDYYAQARVLEEAHGQPAALAVTLHEIGRVYAAQEQWAEALDYYAQARVLEEAHGQPADLAATLHEIGRVYQEQEQWAEALDYYAQARVLKEAHGQPADLARTLHQIGRVYQVLGDQEKANNFFNQAEKVKKNPDSSAGASNLSSQT